jgi:hypothetical protein
VSLTSQIAQQDPICSETSRATAFDFYDGVLVFWIK